MTGASAQLIASTRRRLYGRRRTFYMAAAILSSVLLLFAAGAPAKPVKASHLKLTGIVNKVLTVGGKARLSLMAGGLRFGKITGLHCGGAGFEEVCSWHMRLKSYRSKLRVGPVTWTCHLKPGGFRCGRGIGGVFRRSGERIGTVKVKSLPGKFSKHKGRVRFVIRLSGS